MLHQACVLQYKRADKDTCQKPTLKTSLAPLVCLTSLSTSTSGFRQQHQWASYQHMITLGHVSQCLLHQNENHSAWSPALALLLCRCLKFVDPSVGVGVATSKEKLAYHPLACVRGLPASIWHAFVLAMTWPYLVAYV